jgi:hypothetical protein
MMSSRSAVIGAGILAVVVAVPASAQQGQVVVHRGSSTVRVNPTHPHGGPPGQLKRLYGRLPPGQAKKLYGSRSFDSGLGVEFEDADRKRFERTRIVVRPAKLKTFYPRIPRGQLNSRGARGGKQKMVKNR